MDSLILISLTVVPEAIYSVPKLMRAYSELYGADSQAEPHPHQQALDKLVTEMGLEIPVRATDSYGYQGASLLGRATVYVPPLGPFDGIIETAYSRSIIETLSKIKLNHVLWRMFFIVMRVSIMCAAFLLFPTYPGAAWLGSFVCGLVILMLGENSLNFAAREESLKYLSPALKESWLKFFEKEQKENLKIRNDVEDLTAREKLLLDLYIDANGNTLTDQIFGWAEADQYRESLENMRKV